MKKPKKVDVVIVGAGPVGLFAALALRRRGFSVETVDSGSHGSTHSYALTLHPATLDLFEEFGLLNKVLDGARKISRVDFFRDRRLAAGIDLRFGGLRNPYLAVVGQNHLETILEEALNEYGVHVRWKHRAREIDQDSDGVRVGVDELEGRVVGYAVAHGAGFVRRTKVFNASLVIGADGFESFVRRNLRIPFPEVAPHEDYAVFEFDAECGSCDALQIIEKNGLMNVRWPIGKNGCRWSFQLDREGTPPEYLRRKDPELIQRVNRTEFGALDAERLHNLLAERVPWCPANVKQNYWNLWVRFERRLAERFGSGRVWLAGDAGHLTGPVGVQGMNFGLLEAEDLAGRMAGVLAGSASLDIFDDYNRDRLSEWRFLLGLEGELKPMPDIDTGLTDLRKRLLSCLPASGAELELFAGKLGFEVSGWSPCAKPEKPGAWNAA